MNRTLTISSARSSQTVWTKRFARCWEEAEHRIARIATSTPSEVHGPAHWRAVALAGARICRSLPDADLLTVLLFSVTHDACRICDEEDPEHGQRAAGSLDALLMGWAGELEPWRRDLLAEACKYHADGFTADDQTIGACWDADRLCLWRGETAPHPDLMSTAPGKSARLIHWARDLHLREVWWTDVADVLEGGIAGCLDGAVRAACAS